MKLHAAFFVAVTGVCLARFAHAEAKTAAGDAAPASIAATETTLVGAPAGRPQSSPANPLSFAPGAVFPGGYVPVPSLGTAVRLGGFLKLDAIHDTGPYTGDAADLPNLPVAGDPSAVGRNGLTRLHARESRLALGLYTPTAAGPVLALVEVDFFGAGGANTYGLRMRHAYLSWKALLAGHTFSNFLDLDARGTTIEFNGPTAAGNRKRPQIRFTHPLSEALTAALAFENGATDYTDAAGARITAADALIVPDSAVVQQLPDVTGQLRYTRPAGHLAARGMVRQLRVLMAEGAGRTLTLPGYGLAVSGRWQPRGRSNVFAQATGGAGIGGYVDDLDGQAASFDVTGRRLAAQVGYAGLIGGEAYLGERWRTNLIASTSGVRLDAQAPRGPGLPPLSTRFVQLFANIIHAPARDLVLGFEYAYLRRETNLGRVGASHRLQLGILFRFGG